MSRRGRSSLVGILLILIGLWMLADRLGCATFEWNQVYPLVILLLGIGFLARVFGDGDTHAILPGSVLILIGLFFVLRNYGIIPYLYSDEYWPLLMAILGLGFVVQYLTAPRSFGPLIPGGVLLFFGIALFGDRMGYWFTGEVLRYWPLILVLAGLVMVLNSLERRS